MWGSPLSAAHCQPDNLCLLVLLRIMGAADWDLCNLFKTLSLSASLWKWPVTMLSASVCWFTDGVAFVNHVQQSEATLRSDILNSTHYLLVQSCKWVLWNHHNTWHLTYCREWSMFENSIIEAILRFSAVLYILLDTCPYSTRSSQITRTIDERRARGTNDLHVQNNKWGLQMHQSYKKLLFFLYNFQLHPTVSISVWSLLSCHEDYSVVIMTSSTLLQNVMWQKGPEKVSTVRRPWVAQMSRFVRSTVQTPKWQ